ncbi:MAG: hypothetical protein ACLFS7_02420 [Desulfosudaceae bacterium]
MRLNGCHDNNRGCRPALRYPILAVNMLVLFVLLMAVFGDILFSSGQPVLSMFGADLSDQFVYTRYFGFQQIKQGNFPLWNPYIYAGVPFFGLFQSALLYPLNGIFLVLPLAAAINGNIVLHLFLSGLLMYLWAGFHGRRPLASLLSGIMAMFGGAGYLHVFPGHLSLVCALPWAILIFLCIDGVEVALTRADGKKVSVWRAGTPWWGLGALAVCLQVLAGHPQTVFVTAVAAGIYVLCRLTGGRGGWRLPAAFIFMYFIGAVLSAVQLSAGVAAAADSIRQGGVFYEFAAMFSFPPENLLTLVAPGFFGDMHQLPYWGRCYLWEANLFFGVTGLVLLLAGLGRTFRDRRLAWAVTALVLFLLALGKHTPLFSLLYGHVPGFDWFRGSSKFVMPAFLFMIMLAAAGFDRLQTGRRPPRLLVPVCVGLALAGIIGALFLWHQGGTATADTWWGRFMQDIGRTGEGYLPARYYQQAALLRQAAGLAGNGLATAAGLFLVNGLLFWKANRSRLFQFLIFVLAVAELAVFARHFRPAFDLERSLSPIAAELSRSLGANERILNISRHNAGMLYGIGDLWGINPGVRRRYAELMAVSQGKTAANASQYLTFRRYPPVFRLLRCGAVIEEEAAAGKRKVIGLKSPLPRAFLAETCKVLTDKEEILRYVTDPAFDPRAEVILEEDPDLPESAGTSSGSLKYKRRVNIVSSSTDSLVMEVETPRPAILVVTDAYSRGWRAESAGEEKTREYRVMPADYALRGIPVPAGRHEIRLFYRPALISAGMMISIGGWGVFLLWLIWYGAGRRRSER